MINRYAIILAALATAATGVHAQTALPAALPASVPLSFDKLIDKAVARENALIPRLRTMHPLAETYIQEMAKDADFGLVPHTDHYFLGKVDLTRGISPDSLIPKSGAVSEVLKAPVNIFSVKFLPGGFAQMMFIDENAFDRGHYDFQFLRREFLGDVRTWVVNVSPKKGSGHGRFDGRIWIEDKGFNIVRFNGTYGPPGALGLTVFLHFDSWRVNCGPDLWVPFKIYSEESDAQSRAHLGKLNYKAVTQLWGYTKAEDRVTQEFTNMTVDLPSLKDNSPDAADYSAVESIRNWKREAENNILDRLENANMLSPAGSVEKILDTVVNNIIVTNDLHIVPDVRTRVVLTTPLETFAIGHTIVISRGLLDTLPDEASLAAMLTHELAHIILGHDIDTMFAFSDRTNFNDDQILRKFRFARSQAQEEAANKKALELLQKSPYNDRLRQAGLFLKALGSESDRLPFLIKPLEGDRLAERSSVLRMAALLETAPELQRTRTDQIAALPLGARTKLDPWTDELRMSRTNSVPPLSAGEKMPFEITPVFLHLTYYNQPEQLSAESSSVAEPAAPEPAAVARSAN